MNKITDRRYYEEFNDLSIATRPITVYKVVRKTIDNNGVAWYGSAMFRGKDTLYGKNPAGMTFSKGLVRVKSMFFETECIGGYYCYPNIIQCDNTLRDIRHRVRCGLYDGEGVVFECQIPSGSRWGVVDNGYGGEIFSDDILFVREVDMDYQFKDILRTYVLRGHTWFSKYVWKGEGWSDVIK